MRVYQDNETRIVLVTYPPGTIRKSIRRRRFAFPQRARGKKGNEACNGGFHQIHRTHRKEGKVQQGGDHLSEKKSRERHEPVHEQAQPSAPEQQIKHESDERRDDERKGERRKREQEKLKGQS